MDLNIRKITNHPPSPGSPEMFDEKNEILYWHIHIYIYICRRDGDYWVVTRSGWVATIWMQSSRPSTNVDEKDNIGDSFIILCRFQVGETFTPPHRPRKNTHITNRRISNSVTHLWSFTNTAIAEIMGNATETADTTAPRVDIAYLRWRS